MNLSRIQPVPFYRDNNVEKVMKNFKLFLNLLNKNKSVSLFIWILKDHCILLQENAEEFGKALGTDNYKCSEVPGKISGESVNTKVSNQWIQTMWSNIRKNYKEGQICKFKGKKCCHGNSLDKKKKGNCL